MSRPALLSMGTMMTLKNDLGLLRPRTASWLDLRRYRAIGDDDRDFSPAFHYCVRARKACARRAAPVWMRLMPLSIGTYIGVKG